MRWLAYAALWLFVFSVPWENSLVIPGLGVISRFTGMLAFGMTMVAIVVTGRIRRWQAFHVAALLFVIWVGGVLWVNSNEPTLPLKFWTYPQLFLVLWMVWELAHSRLRQTGLMLAFVFGALVTAFQTIITYRLQAELRRFSTGTSDPNAVAMTLALALPIAWYVGMTHHRTLVRWVCRAYLPVGLLAMALTGSRGGLIAGMIGLLIVPLTMVRLSPAKLATVILLLALSGGLAATYVPDRIVQRLASTRESVGARTLGGRAEIWRAGLQAFAHRPLTGYGTGAFRTAAFPWLGEMRSAHNSFISVLVEQGIVGFILYSAMFVIVFRAILTLPLLERRFALVLFATLVVTMLPLTSEESKPVWFILAALLGFSRAQGGWPGRAIPQTGRATTSRPAPRRPLEPGPPLSTPVRRAGPDMSA